MCSLPVDGKSVVWGFSGGIAACKAASYARNLTVAGARVIPVMTSSARQFVTELTLSALTGEKVWTDMFERDQSETIPHIDIARKADLFVVAPATANIIAKCACGIADDLLSTLFLSFEGRILFCPSMNPAMYRNAVVQSNIERLRSLGYWFVEPGYGNTACGETGQGRLAEWEAVSEEIARAFTAQSLSGKRVLVSAGPTREAIDPVRYISNRSSGKMGFAIAREARRRGAVVTLVSGPVSEPYPYGTRVVEVIDAAEMARTVRAEAKECDVLVMTAAVADYRPVTVSAQKIKKSGERLVLELERTEDIISSVADLVPDSSVMVGFCAETCNLVENARKKVVGKGLDMIVANDVSAQDAGFEVDDNRVVIIDRNGREHSLPLMSKQAVAGHIWDLVEVKMKEKRSATAC
jgi:phosphopantothenoylcysteine decarboxylase/phosphopantothenate--cysteine ligase